MFKSVVSLQLASLLFPLISPPSQYLACLQPAIVLALSFLLLHFRAVLPRVHAGTPVRVNTHGFVNRDNCSR
jgi:hypothetical protein